MNAQTITAPFVPPQDYIAQWGETMRLARRAAHLTIEDAKQRGAIKNPLECILIVLTDCPVAAGWFAYEARQDLAEICGVSHIDNVLFWSTDNLTGKPEHSFEAKYQDFDKPSAWEETGMDAPRVWVRLK